MKKKKTRKEADKTLPERELQASEQPGSTELREAAVEYKVPMKLNVRSAKDRFSQVVELASQGHEITITSDGEPKAKIVAFRKERKRFQPNWDLIKGWETSSGRTGTEIIREDRDSRG